MESEEYISCDGIRFHSGLAARFYKQYKSCILNKKTENAFCAIHHAAWACDDMKDNKNATRCRDLAIPLIDKLISGKLRNKENLKLIRADLLRRAGHFEKVITDYSSTVFENEIMDKVRKFQIKKAEQKDTLCYTVEEAVK